MKRKIRFSHCKFAKKHFSADVELRSIVPNFVTEKGSKFKKKDKMVIFQKVLFKAVEFKNKKNPKNYDIFELFLIFTSRYVYLNLVSILFYQI